MPYTPEPLPTYTFQRNGQVATVHRIGQMTIAHIAASAEKKIPQVPIPLFDVDMGGGMTKQPNPADPAYQQAVAARRGLVNLATMDALMELAIDIEIDLMEFDRLKTTMDLLGMPLDEISEKVAYIKHCCISDGSELAALGSLIRGELEAATEAAQATFSGDLPGQAAIPLESTAVRRPVRAEL